MIHLHVGSGKAGSTSIQQFIAGMKNDSPVGRISAFGEAGHAWKLAVSLDSARSRFYWVNKRKRVSDREYDDIVRTVWREASREKERSGLERFVASCEQIAGQCEFDALLAETLASRLRGIFGEVHVIFYLRDQVSFLKSLYAQSVRGPTRSRKSFRAFIETMDEAEHRWNYARKIAMWESVVGRDNLTVVPFDARNFFGGTLVGDFASRIGASSPSGAEGDAMPYANRSPGYGQLRILRMMNVTGVEAKTLRRVVESATVGAFFPAEFPENYDATILWRVSKGNAWLNKRFFGDFQVGLPVEME